MSKQGAATVNAGGMSGGGNAGSTNTAGGRVNTRNNTSGQQNRSGVNQNSYTGGSGVGGGSMTRARTSGPPVVTDPPQEGVYVNERLMYISLALIGCNVEVLVKNGQLFEGIFKTFSHSFEVVLLLASVKKASGGGGQISEGSNPHNTVIIQLADIVYMQALNVDLDYAVTSGDSFTDASISNKANGQMREKELQPWEGDVTGDDSIDDALEDRSMGGTGGWDANDMFRTNQEKFNVQTNYDEDLSQYTTKLQREDTQEYRQREALAARIANEMEGGSKYVEHAALENGDDEEMAFSAVRRNPPPQTGTQSNESREGKYLPPHLRVTSDSGGTGRDCGGGGAQRPQQSIAPMQQQQWSQPADGRRQQDARQDIAGGTRPQNPPPTMLQQHQQGATVIAENLRQQENFSSSSEDNTLTSSGRGLVRQPDTAAGVSGGGKSASPSLGGKANELKDFHANFKLSDQVNHSRRQGAASPTHISGGGTVNANQVVSPRQQQVISTATGTGTTMVMPSTPELSEDGTSLLRQPLVPSSQVGPIQSSGESFVPTEKSEGDEDGRRGSRSQSPATSGSETSITAKKSTTTFTLNPNAKEFNPNPKPFIPQAVPTPTPPPAAIVSSATQSPVVYQQTIMQPQQQQLMSMQMPPGSATVVYQQPQQPPMTVSQPPRYQQPQQQQQQQQPQQQRVKQVTVSARPAMNDGRQQQIAAIAAAGPPLITQQTNMGGPGAGQPILFHPGQPWTTIMPGNMNMPVRVFNIGPSGMMQMHDPSGGMQPMMQFVSPQMVTHQMTPTHPHPPPTSLPLGIHHQPGSSVNSSGPAQQQATAHGLNHHQQQAQQQQQSGASQTPGPPPPQQIHQYTPHSGSLPPGMHSGSTPQGMFTHATLHPPQQGGAGGGGGGGAGGGPGGAGPPLNTPQSPQQFSLVPLQFAQHPGAPLGYVTQGAHGGGVMHTPGGGVLHQQPQQQQQGQLVFAGPHMMQVMQGPGAPNQQQMMMVGAGGPGGAMAHPGMVSQHQQQQQHPPIQMMYAVHQ